MIRLPPPVFLLLATCSGGGQTAQHQSVCGHSGHISNSLVHEGASGDLYERGLALPLATYLRVLCSVSVPSCYKYISQTTTAPSLFHPSLVPERNGHMNISTVRIDLIKAARGLTNVDLAADCGISRQSISAILRPLLSTRSGARRRRRNFLSTNMSEMSRPARCWRAIRTRQITASTPPAMPWSLCGNGVLS